MEETNVTVHSLILPLEGANLLLPNASVAEIIGYSEPEPVNDAPDWYMGTLDWRGLKVPLIAFEALSGKARPSTSGKVRISIFNALGGNPEMPFFAMVTQGIPRLSLVSQGMVTLSEGGDPPPCVLSNVQVRGESALIPDLDAIEDMIRKNTGNKSNPGNTGKNKKKRKK